MPANSRPKKSSSKSAKKTTRKVAKKAAKTSKRVAKKKVAKKKAAKKKVAKKAAGKTGKKVARKSPKKAATPAKGSRRKGAGVSMEPRHEMIAKAAYYRAEKRGFEDGDPVVDWLSAEQEVDAILSRSAR